MSHNIATLSLQALNQGQKLEELATACHEWGFFRLVDHGIAPATQAAFLRSMHDFFDQPAAENQKLSRTEQNPWGYYDRELTKTRQDWKEIFDLGIDQTNPIYRSYTPWPNNQPTFQSTMLDWHQRCNEIGLALVKALAASLGQPETALDTDFSPENSSFLRLNHYPVCPAPADVADDFPSAGHLGINHHTDAGAVTVLFQDNVSGLQVRHNEQWHTIDSIPDSLIINVGDLMQIWSNDWFVAPLHRVLANSQQERYSAAFFLNPRFETNCAPLGNVSPHYRTLNWGDFRASRAAGDYANLGTEAQISDYRIS